ncbi:DUF1640 domain-containing protein [Rhodoferax sp.]|jgi:transcriptional antiterminator Rof (Rho-off)|uniref:DUF1640 domain-containing protein n=1 Tax=Pseudomonadota TaxID=1224 RepID=UPI003BB05692
MSVITFDTLKFAERLEKAGLTREQAAAFADAQKDVFAEALDTQVATKADIVRLENRLEQMELKLTVKLGALTAASIGVVAALVKML